MPRSFSADIGLQIPAGKLGSLKASALTGALTSRVLNGLTADERASAATKTEVVSGTSLTLSLSGDASDPAYLERVRAAILAQACRGQGPSCRVEVGSSARARGRVLASTVTFKVVRSVRTPIGEPLGTDADNGDALADPATCTDADGRLSDCIADLATQLSNTVVSGLPSDMGASLVGHPSVTDVGIVLTLTSLGTDTSNIGSSTQLSTLQAGVAGDLNIASSDLTVADVAVTHPPRPPPRSPPMPGQPPIPPESPPPWPNLPPFASTGLQPQTDGCPSACVGGCLRGKWSNMYSWVGQGIALGAQHDDALYTWPGFLSNVTINRCRTVELDIDINVQLFSIVVWGTLEITNRENALVSLRSVCMTIKPGGRIVAGSAVTPFKGMLDFVLSGDDLTETPQCGLLKGKVLEVERGGQLELYGSAPTGSLWARRGRRASILETLFASCPAAALPTPSRILRSRLAAQPFAARPSPASVFWCCRGAWSWLWATTSSWQGPQVRAALDAALGSCLRARRSMNAQNLARSTKSASCPTPTAQLTRRSPLLLHSGTSTSALWSATAGTRSIWRAR